MRKIIDVGGVKLGGGHIVIQSMTNTRTSDIPATVKQINELAEAGAELVRVSVPDAESAEAVKEIVKKAAVPLIGDIHYSARHAINAIENGISKIRVNPYNMSDDDISAVVKKCIGYGVPIRVGVNKGSSKNAKTPKELALSAVECAKKIEDLGFDKIVLSVKTSDVKETVEAYRYLAGITDYPLHIGLTESGTAESGIIKSAVAAGSLLLDGIGDTLRVSLAGNPLREVAAAKKILRAVGIDRDFVEVIACPTCARTSIDVEKIASDIEKFTANIKKPLKVAVMGCVVNGIGESHGADIGVAGGKEKSAVFENGKQIAVVDNCVIEETLMKMITEKTND
jgi:(E)-4-hydroxy-3-methylbut-2-enyl-diphosphate synthase